MNFVVKSKTNKISDWTVQEADSWCNQVLTTKYGFSVSVLKNFHPFYNKISQKSANINWVGFPRIDPGSPTLTGFELVNEGLTKLFQDQNQTNGIWLADFYQESFGPIDIYFSYPTLELISFYQLNQHRYDFSQSLFVSSGPAFFEQPIAFLIRLYPFSRYHALFGTDLRGSLATIKLGALLANQKLSIQKSGDELVFQFNSKTLSLPEAILNYSNFKKHSGLRPNLKIHKPKQAKSYLELLRLTTSKFQSHEII